MNEYDALMTKLNAYFPRGATHLEHAPQRIASFERDQRLVLPSAYRSFVARWGVSGFRNYVVFPIAGHPPFGEEGTMGVFLGFTDGAGYDVVQDYREYSGVLPRGVLPVASDPGGNFICLSLGKSSYGQVLFWDHRWSPDASDGPLWSIAEDWLAFLRLLRSGAEATQ